MCVAGSGDGQQACGCAVGVVDRKLSEVQHIVEPIGIDHLACMFGMLLAPNRTETSPPVEQTRCCQSSMRRKVMWQAVVYHGGRILIHRRSPISGARLEQGFHVGMR